MKKDDIIRSIYNEKLYIYKLICTVNNQFICLVSPRTCTLYHEAIVGPMMDSSRRKTEYLRFSLLLRDYKELKQFIFLGKQKHSKNWPAKHIFLFSVFA